MSEVPITTETISIWCPISDAEGQMIAELASVGFSADKIADTLQRQKRLFLRDFRINGTPISDAYKRGLYLAQSETDAVTLENARKGNLTAKQQMEKKWEEQRIENIKNEIFNTE
ncbi:hypothetical protein [Chryseobacterium sp. MP_3.2]|uniref:hypothetical protein n=1 Tax=Chryseobacterium sp. MP_3.2 TaxID=3071712 RepID=UPI002E0995BD|nr:hypothetical protein [Chryseobacterium sp. MP_3.2]